MRQQTKLQKAWQQGQKAQVTARLKGGKPWKHPDKHGQWHTGLDPVKASPATRFTSTGPSKRIKSRRVARASRGRRGRTQ